MLCGTRERRQELSEDYSRAVDGGRGQSRGTRSGRRAGDGQASEWRRDMRDGEGDRVLGPRRAGSGEKNAGLTV